MDTANIATADDVGAVDDGALEGEGMAPVEDEFAGSAAAEWARAAFDEVTAVCPLARAKELSCGERDRLALSDGTLAYGEIVFDPFAATIAKIKARYGGLAARGGRFVDVGSGAGKAVFAAALLHEWDSLLGIEVRGFRVRARVCVRVRPSPTQHTPPARPHPPAPGLVGAARRVAGAARRVEGARV